MKTEKTIGCWSLKVRGSGKTNTSFSVIASTEVESQFFQVTLHQSKDWKDAENFLLNVDNNGIVAAVEEYIKSPVANMVNPVVVGRKENGAKIYDYETPKLKHHAWLKKILESAKTGKRDAPKPVKRK